MAKSKVVEREKEHSTPPAVFGEPIEEMDEEEVEDLAGEPEFDIFEDTGAKLAESGDSVTYTVKKNGTFVEGALPHPQSWNDMRKRYGGGTIQVILRSLRKGGYVKSQTRNLAAPDEEEADLSSVRYPAPQAGGQSTTELFMLMQQMKKDEAEENRRQLDRIENDRREREERLREESSRREIEMRDREEKRMSDEKEKAAKDMSSNNNLMMMMFKMMETQSANTTAMLTAFMTQPKEKKEELSLNKIMEMMDTRMEKTINLLTGAKGKNGEPSVAEQIKMMSDAEERGYKRAREIQSIAEEKAEELAEFREAGGTKPVPEGPSTAKMLIEAAGPALQAFMASRMPSAPAAAVASGNPQSGNPVPQLAGPVAPRPAQAPAVRTAPALPMPAAGRPIIQNRPVGAQIPRQVINTAAATAKAMPVTVTAAQPTSNTESKIERAGLSTPVKPTNELGRALNVGSPRADHLGPAGEMSDMDKKTLIEKTIVAEIGKDLAKNMLSGKFEPENVADRCLTMLKASGINEIYLSSQYSLDDMIKVAKANKIPDAIRPYLERFHARVANLAKSLGEPTIADSSIKAAVGVGGTAPSSK